MGGEELAAVQKCMYISYKNEGLESPRFWPLSEHSRMPIAEPGMPQDRRLRVGEGCDVERGKSVVLGASTRSSTTFQSLTPRLNNLAASNTKRSGLRSGGSARHMKNRQRERFDFAIIFSRRRSATRGDTCSRAMQLW